MKRLLALLLCLVIGLCGCTQGGTEESSLVKYDSKMEESSVAEESSVVVESSKAEESSVVEESSVIEESSKPEESTTEVAPYLTESTPGTWFNAYLEIIEYLSQTHGISFEGLYIAKLLDFNDDGQQELLCVYYKPEEYWSTELIYGYDGEKATLLWSHHAGTCNWGAPLTTILEYEGISYLKFKDGSSDGIYGFDGEIFTLLDTIAYPDEVKQAKYAEYTVTYSVSLYHQDIDNGPQTLRDTMDTRNSLRDLCGVVEIEKPDSAIEEFGSVFEPNPIGAHKITQVYPAGTFSSMEEAYAQIVQELEAEYGVGEIKEFEYSTSYVGLCVVRLIDFDGDGQDELFCGYSVKSLAPEVFAYQKIYSYDGNGGVKLLWDTKAGQSGGVTFYSDVVVGADEKVYVIMSDQDVKTWWTLIGGQFQNVYQYCSGVEHGVPHWNGEEVTQETMLARRNALFDGYQRLINICYTIVDLEQDGEYLPQTQATVEQLYRAAGQ